MPGCPQERRQYPRVAWHVRHLRGNGLAPEALPHGPADVQPADEVFQSKKLRVGRERKRVPHNRALKHSLLQLFSQRASRELPQAVCQRPGRKRPDVAMAGLVCRGLPARVERLRHHHVRVAVQHLIHQAREADVEMRLEDDEDPKRLLPHP